MVVGGFFRLCACWDGRSLGLLVERQARQVTIAPADDCVLINDPSRPGLGKLIPSLVVQEDDMRIRVERTGRRWELKRMELRFSTPEDTSKAVAMLARFLRKS